MKKTQFLTIYPTFESLESVKKTLPSVIKETRQNDAKLIVHDSSVKERNKKWNYLKKFNKNDDFFLLLSSNMSMAHARNACLKLGIELYAPDYVCMIEDDHGYNEGFIEEMVKAMKEYYGKISPNGLRYGLFTACNHCLHVKKNKLHVLRDHNMYFDVQAPPISIGSANSCCRCAPTSHWCSVLKGYDTDEYLISSYQTKMLNHRNYFKGFTTMLVQGGI